MTAAASRGFRDRYFLIHNDDLLRRGGNNTIRLVIAACIRAEYADPTCLST